MNNLKRIFFLIAFSVATISYSQEPVSSSSYAEATIDANYCLVLDADAEIQEFYAADATALNWSSLQDAIKMCGYNSNNLITLQADYENNRILIHVWKDRTDGLKDVVWWNTYLQSICN